MKPRKLRKSSDKPVTFKQAAFARLLTMGMTKKEAALKAGYSLSTAENTKEIEKAVGFDQAKKSIVETMNKRGINDKLVVRRLRDMLMAKHKVFRGGKIVELDDVHPTAVAKALDIISKIRGDYEPLKIKPVENPLEHIPIGELLESLEALKTGGRVQSQ